MWAIFSPKNNVQDIISRKLANEGGKSDIAFKTVTFSEVADGIKYWELNAISSTINKTTNTAYLTSVDGLFFKDGKPTLKFFAPRAVWKLNKQEIRLIEPFGYDIKSEKEFQKELKRIGSIKKLISFFSLPSEKPLSKSKGYWFKAKSLDWKLSTKKLYCEGDIVLTKGDITIRSNKLEADAGLERVLLTDKPSAVVISEKDRSKLNAKAESFLVDSNTDNIYAYNDVTIKSRSATLRSLNAVYDQKDKKISMLKGVHLDTRNIQAWSDHATYSLSDHIAELSGGARAVRDKSELQGEKIIVLTEEGRLFIIGRSKAKISESEIEKLQ
ncbi:LptA/OstA family protein [Candidatus Margulisiibacteriota bacterium]